MDTEKPGRLWRGRQTGLLVMTFILVCAIGLSGLVYPSTYAPLIVLGGIILVAASCICIWKPELALYATIFVVLLPAGLIPGTYQSLLNRTLTVITFLAWLVNVIIFRKRIRLTTSSLFMLGFVLWSALTLVWAQDRSTGTTVLQMYALRWILFLVVMVNINNTLRSLNGLMTTLALIGLLLALVSIQAALSGAFDASKRLQVFTANENGLGVLAELALVGVLWHVFNSTAAEKPLKLLTATAYFVCVIAIVGLSGSRGSAISLLLIVIALGAWKVTRPWAVLGLLLLISGVAFALYATTLQRFVSEAGSTLLGVRITLWQAAWQLIGQHPLGGVGIGNSDTQILPFLNALDRAAGTSSVSIHNPILVIWSETGILGLLLYLGCLVSAVWSFIRQYALYRRLDPHGKFTPYFAIVASIALGYMASWIKGGGMQADFTYFLVLGLLLFPSRMMSDQVLSSDQAR